MKKEHSVRKERWSFKRVPREKINGNTWALAKAGVTFNPLRIENDLFFNGSTIFKN